MWCQVTHCSVKTTNCSVNNPFLRCLATHCRGKTAHCCVKEARCGARTLHRRVQVALDDVLPLNALPVHLLRQVFLFSLNFRYLFFLFLCSCSVRFLEVLKGSLGAHRVDLGATWGAFGGHFDNFWVVRWIFENVCFTIVKQYFLRFGRV